MPHEGLIDKLDSVSQTFRVLIIKTTMTVPYTSVFLQLDCAYSGVRREKGLRAKMAAAGVSLSATLLTRWVTGNKAEQFPMHAKTPNKVSSMPYGH